MAAIKDAKNIGPAFSNEEVVIRAIYDFAEDGGAVGALDIFEANEDIVITHFSTHVKTAVTSTGNLTLAVGVTGATTALLTATQGAKANLTTGAVLFPLDASGADDTSWAPTIPRRLAKGQKVLQTIGTEVANAGKVEYCIKYVRA
jgi:hypothetical protein